MVPDYGSDSITNVRNKITSLRSATNLIKNDIRKRQRDHLIRQEKMWIWYGWYFQKNQRTITLRTARCMIVTAKGKQVSRFKSLVYNVLEKMKCSTWLLHLSRRYFSLRRTRHLTVENGETDDRYDLASHRVHRVRNAPPFILWSNMLHDQHPNKYDTDNDNYQHYFSSSEATQGLSQLATADIFIALGGHFYTGRDWSESQILISYGPMT